MGVVAFLVVAAALVVVAYLVARAARKRRTPPELRGDWWTAFEREFRAYARMTGHRRRGRRRGSAGR